MTTVVTLDQYLEQILRGKTIFSGLVNVYCRAVAIQTNQFFYQCQAPQICYHFSYPIGETTYSVLYRCADLLRIGDVANKTDMMDIYSQTVDAYKIGDITGMLDGIAAMIIRGFATINELMDMIQKTAVFRRAGKNFCYIFKNPFVTGNIDIFPQQKTYGVTIMNTLINASNCGKYNDIFYIIDQ